MPPPDPKLKHWNECGFGYTIIVLWIQDDLPETARDRQQARMHVFAPHLICHF